MKNNVILITGTAGTGKTTIARELCHRLKYNHRIGTGFIREIVKTNTTKKENPELFTYTFRPQKSDAITSFVEQARILKKSINAVINRANNEGTSIIIEGNHIISSYYPGNIFVLLSPKNDRKHRKMLVGNTHSKRKITDKDFKNIQDIEKYLVIDALRTRGKTLVCHAPITKMVGYIMRNIIE